jgi:hypothetical protein
MHPLDGAKPDRARPLSRKAAGRRRTRRWLRLFTTAISIALVGGVFVWAVVSMRDLDRPITQGFEVPGTSDSANYRKPTQ